MLKLEFPELKHKKAYEDMILEWWKFENLSNISPWALFHWNNFYDFLEITKNYVNNAPWVNSHLFFLVDWDRILWSIQVRHHINHPNLIKVWWHIWYWIRPSERKKWYATIMLKLWLEKAKKLWINKILITCDDTNMWSAVASAKVIEKNGWVFESIALKNWDKMRRYWIEL